MKSTSAYFAKHSSLSHSTRFILISDFLVKWKFAFSRLSLHNISCGTCLCCHWFFPPCSSQPSSYFLEPSCGALHRFLACMPSGSLNCHIISGFLASACVSAGVQGKQHIPVHLAGESCLLLCQRHHPCKVDQEAEGGQGEDQPPVWFAQDRLMCKPSVGGGESLVSSLEMHDLKWSVLPKLAFNTI